MASLEAARPGLGSARKDDQAFTVGVRVDQAGMPQPYRPRREDPLFRLLRIFTSDPEASRLEGGVAVVQVPYEPLEEGPRGAIFTVEDIDANRFEYERLSLDEPANLIRNGRNPSASDHLFHQQMVYAVASLVYAAFRQALGRDLGWSFLSPQLGLEPHGINAPNAYYDPSRGVIRFGYFRAHEDPTGRNLPGGYVYTCLSHDVIAHEVTHALLDGLRARFSVPSGPDVPAFHEAFADIVAIFQHFSHQDVVLAALQRSGGRIRYASLLTDLAAQFGHTTGSKNALRSAIDASDAPPPYDRVEECHQRGSSLVSAVFEAFSTVFERKTRRYLRLATGGSGIVPPGDLPEDLKRVLAEEAAKLAKQFLNICIRAVDYCPPVDLQFGEYLRAIITADHDLVTDDPWAYREAFIDAFRRRRIFPPDVRNLGEDALLWDGPSSPIQSDELNYSKLGFEGDPGRAVGRRERLEQADAIGQLVTKPELREQFGLCPPDPKGMSAPRVHSVRTTRRVGPDGQIIFDLVAEITQKREVRSRDGTTEFFGGCTVIFDPEGEVRYIVAKRASSESRLLRQQGFLESPHGRRLWERSGDVIKPRTELLFQLLDAPDGGG